MEIIADLHIHSCFSRATSRDMNFRSIEGGAAAKGLNVLGTGDFTHPRWREEIKGLEHDGEGIYRLPGGRTAYVISGEVATIFERGGRSRRIHHLILLPSLEVAEQLCETLAERGDLEADGRPMLHMTGAELVEAVTDLGEWCLVIPAHIWTPWFSLFGDRGGVDSVEECFEDQTPHIYALETGLSSDPPMNWRVSGLDRFTLVSNSDSHSPSPWRIGREANIIEVQRLTYRDIAEAIMYRKADVATIEVDPAYGKYHYTGHREHGVSVPPKEAIRLKGICPVCGRRMTKGVAERVEELADREEGYPTTGGQRFTKILPLSEIIGATVGRDPFSAEVQRAYWRIIKEFGNEFEVLLRAPEERLRAVCGERVARLVLMSREDRVKVIPGYDGVYGRLQPD